MIFFITAAVITLLSVYFIKIKWSKLWAKAVFCVNILFIIILLIAFGFNYNVNLSRPAASRKTVVAAVDISASTGIRYKDISGTLSSFWNNYNTEIIPFSSKVVGPEGADGTALLRSLKDIVSYITGNYNKNDIAGLVVITDGNETENIADVSRTDKITAQKDFPFNVIFIKPVKNANFDKSVSLINTPRFIPRYSKEVISFGVYVSGSELEGVPVNVKHNGRNIGTRYVKLKDGYGEGRFELVIKNAGMNLIEASIAVDSRESITDNNSDFAMVEGIFKGFRVLHISGHPSTDSAFIRRGLQNIPGVDMISFYILRTNGQVSKARDSELSLIPFPTDQLFRDELDNFDLIIINDFKLSNFLSPFYIDNIVKFVESGGGLLIFGGPESFMPEDFIANKFESILPVFPSVNNYINTSFIIQSNSIAQMTPLAELAQYNNFTCKGINAVKVKDWSNVFYRTVDGKPVIAGGIKGKGRVIAVLTDSFWKFSYNSSLQGEAALKSLIRYVLGIPQMPVKISDNNISFVKPQSSKDEISAKIQFLNNNGTLQKEENLTGSGIYKTGQSDSRLVNIIIKQKGRVIENYQLLNHGEKKWREMSYLPAGMDFLKALAEKGGGKFIITEREKIGSLLHEIVIKNPVSTLNTEKIRKPIYMHKGILLLFLYLAVCSFYLKSRYME